MSKPPQNLRKTLRREFRNARQALSETQQNHHARCVKKLILCSGLLNRCSRVAAYFPFDGELDLSLLIEQLLYMGKKVYLPLIRSENRMEFRALNSKQEMCVNRYGIPEPDPDHSKLSPLWTMSAIFLPLLAFDASGNRMGMGGGYYDRALCKLHPRPLCIGVGHELQFHSDLNSQVWDEKMDAVVTEKKIHIFSQTAAIALKMALKENCNGR